MKNLALFFGILLAPFAAEAQPVITQQPTNQIVPGGGPATFSVSVSGTGPFAYQWQFNGTNLPITSNTNIITTIAGNGTNSFSGDGSAATSAALSNPTGVTVDASGHLFIADYGNNRVRMVNTYGIITSVAGNGTTNSMLGDGGSATNATLWKPSALAVDSRGNLFIADSKNNRIRMVNTNGIITTVAGNGTFSYSGDGGPATNATLRDPQGIAVDVNGNLFIADYRNNLIRMVNTNGIITTFAGGYQARSFYGDNGPATNAALWFPSDVKLCADGSLYIADVGNNRIRVVDTNGIITTIAGSGGSSFFSGDGGNVTNATLNEPHSIARDQNGNLFIADTINCRVRMVNTNGIITTIAGNGDAYYFGDGSVATSATLNYPWGIAIDNSGSLFIADSGNSRIRKLSNLGLPSLTINALSQAVAGDYSVIVTSSSGSVTSSVAHLSITAVPVSIQQQPASVVVPALASASFAVIASGFPAPSSYQWTHNDTNLPGAISNSITINHVRLSDLGNYQVQIGNGYSSTNSDIATLNMAPSITSPFGGATMIWGMDGAISVGAIGSGALNYQWFDNGVAIDGATNATLNFAGIQFTNGGLYSVVVSSPFGTVTNIAAQVVINPAGVSMGFCPALTISGVVGFSYTIQSSTNLADINAWSTLTNLTLTQPVQLWVDTNVDASSPFNSKYFYRVLPGQ